MTACDPSAQPVLWTTNRTKAIFFRMNTAITTSGANFRSSARLPSAVFSVVFVCATSLVAIFICDDLFHWLLVPVMACGILVGIDTVNWARGYYEPLDPAGIVGLFGVHFFFIAVLLQIGWDFGMAFVHEPGDWRPWIGAMAYLNLLGLLTYRLARFLVATRLTRLGTSRARWTISRRRFLPIVNILLVITGTLQLLIYLKFGGISDYVAAYENRTGEMAGLGWVFMICESFPILLLLRYAVVTSGRGVRPSWQTIIVVLLAFFALKMLFGGLRGSRSNTLWGVFWAAGIIHIWIRPFSRKALVCGVAVAIGFAYIYGFYKGGGREALADLRSEHVSVLDVEENTGRSLRSTLLGDLSRVNVQAFLLYRLQKPYSDFRYARGRTYVGALCILIPKRIWNNRPPHKVKEGTDALYGNGTYAGSKGKKVASRVYGLAGEAMLNFGPPAVPFAFFGFGILVATLRNFLNSLDPSDMRWLLAPLLVILCLVVLMSDSDNVLFFFVKNGFLPTLALVLGSTRKSASVHS